MHFRGDPVKWTGLVPLPGHPVIVSYDPGPKNFSIHCEPLIPMNVGKILLIVFDEMKSVANSRSTLMKPRCEATMSSRRTRWALDTTMLPAFPLRHENGGEGRGEVVRGLQLVRSGFSWPYWL